MKTVITEKPGVAREIAILLGAVEKKEGYLKGNGYFVTWTFGHLVQLGSPEDYGICTFEKKSLPILPKPFLLTPRKEKKGGICTSDLSAIKQLKIIGQLFEESERIIVATEAGCEGELIFRHIYEYLNCTKPFERLWISSLTQKAVRHGLDNLKSENNFEGLYKAAQARSLADWLVGHNASRALSIALGGAHYSLGRIQTPALSLICSRYLENKAFSVKKNWQIQLFHTREFIDFKSFSTNKWEDKASAEHAVKCIERNGNTAIVTSVENKKIVENAPLLFDLAGLQKEASKILNFSAAETLNIAQSLYENKFITYPRTASQYIAEDMWEEIHGMLRLIQKTGKYNRALTGVKWGCLNKSIVNELCIADHHGMLITERIPFSLSAKENALYNMIALRLIEAVSNECVKEITAVSLQVLHYEFTLKSSKIIETGWRIANGIFSDDETEALQELPELKTGDELKIKNAFSYQKTTCAPIPYTEAGLLSAMETAGKEPAEQKDCSALQNTGIGTPCSRAAAIETLLIHNYIERRNKHLIPTEKGLKVYELVRDKKISNLSMATEWEEALLKIENNKSNAADFQKKMEDYAVCISAELLEASAKSKSPDLLCPKCNKEHLLIADKIVKCPNEFCNWFQFRNVCGALLSLSDIESLVKSGKTPLLKAMRSKAGKIFDAYITLNNKGESSFEFEKSKLKDRSPQHP